MRSHLLLPTVFKKIGILLLIPSLVWGIADSLNFQLPFLDDLVRNFKGEITLTGLILGLLFIAFARQKHEDEFINRIRLESLQWAVIINYALLLIATWVVYGLSYLDVMLWNMLTVLILFVIRFHVMLYRSQSSND